MHLHDCQHQPRLSLAKRPSRRHHGAMCYSAQVIESYNVFVRMYGAAMSLQQFYYTYFSRSRDPKIRIPKSVDAWFSNPTTDLEREIKTLIDQWNADQTSSLEQELFKQRKRLADAERTLLTKTTKKAQEDQRIAGNKIELARGKLSDLRRTEFVDSDARFFPGWYAPVMIVEDGHYVVKPMRFRYRFPGWNDAIEREKDGSYNARMDNIATKWRGPFGHRHGILMANRFYENVSRHAVEGRELRSGEKEENVVLEFNPQSRENMLVACLWTLGKRDDGGEMYSFAAITTDPPAEIAAVGHDRCIIPLKPENVDAWMHPDPNDLSASYAILEDRQRPYYEHSLAA